MIKLLYLLVCFCIILLLVNCADPAPTEQFGSSNKNDATISNESNDLDNWLAQKKDILKVRANE